MLSPLNDGVLARINLPDSINIILAIFVGYLVGQIFRFSRASDDQIVDKDYIYQPKTVRPIFLSLILAIGLNLLLVIGDQANVFQTIRKLLLPELTEKIDEYDVAEEVVEDVALDDEEETTLLETEELTPVSREDQTHTEEHS